MSSRKVRGDAGEAAYAQFREADGCKVLPLSPSLPGADLCILDGFGHMEIVEVKTWDRPLNPDEIQKAMVKLLAHRDMMSGVWKRRTSVVIVHAVRDPDAVGTDGWDFIEVWRFP